MPLAEDKNVRAKSKDKDAVADIDRYGKQEEAEHSVGRRVAALEGEQRQGQEHALHETHSDHNDQKVDVGFHGCAVPVE